MRLRRAAEVADAFREQSSEALDSENAAARLRSRTLQKEHRVFADVAREAAVRTREDASGSFGSSSTSAAPACWTRTASRPRKAR
jgi:hypothetical protein